MFVLLLLSVAGICFAELETCERDYAKYGCFKRNKSLFPDMLANNRDSHSSVYTGDKIDWKNFQGSLHDLACKCAKAASENGYEVFAIGFYGECHAGKSKTDFEAWAADGASNNCIGADYGACDENKAEECTGGAHAEYVYAFLDKAPEPINGGFTDWSEYTACSASCGAGIQERERQCTNPLPQNGGAECSGRTSEVKECQIVECPVDGGFSDWEEYSECSASCGGGSQSRSRSCSNPAPAHGGKNCEGPATEEQTCNESPCPVNGGYSDWEEYSECSASCGGGSQSRSRSCNNPAPAHGGVDCVGPATEEQTCNKSPCPVNGGYSDWEEYSKCSASCGGGSQSRSRSCNNPAPAHGGVDCVGPATEEQTCNENPCPVDGVISSWSSYSSCSKSCGSGSQMRTRTCTGPFHGGKACEGSLTETRSCGTEICLVKTDLESKIKNLMSSHQSEDHSTFRYTLKNSLSSTYPSYYFTVSVYNPCSGWEAHTVTGYSYVAIFRQYNRNVVVTYTKKTSSFPSSSKRTEIKNAVVNEIKNKGQSAKTSNDLAWAKAKSYGVPIASVHVVRFGNGLRTAVGSYADFQNFVCENTCNWLNQCTDHQSSIVIVFGSA